MLFIQIQHLLIKLVYIYKNMPVEEMKQTAYSVKDDKDH
jgi:hypothetical protein